jgi:hypothetical protein
VASLSLIEALLRGEAGADMFRDFAARLAEEFACGHRFVDDLPKIPRASVSAR